MVIKNYALLPLMMLMGATAVSAATGLVEAKAGYFYPTNNTFRKIYSNGGAIYGIELGLDACWGFQLWTSGSYFSKSGFSIGERDKTRITLVPLAGGLKYFVSCSCVDFYLGAGVLGTYFQTTTVSPFMLDRVSKWGVGGIAKIGLLWYLCESLFIDFFADYSYMKLSFRKTAGGALIRQNADVSGASAGGGIGFCF